MSYMKYVSGSMKKGVGGGCGVPPGNNQRERMNGIYTTAEAYSKVSEVHKHMIDKEKFRASNSIIIVKYMESIVYKVGCVGL